MTLTEERRNAHQVRRLNKPDPAPVHAAASASCSSV